jgi:putative transposase
MSRKRTTYSAEFKTKLVLEVLKGDKTLNEIASQNNIIPKNLSNWKEIFLSNAELAMEPSKAVKEYKEQVVELQSKIDKYAQVVGKITVERDWAVGKLKSLDLSNKQKMVEVQAKNISLSQQTQLLGISRSHFYYDPIINEQKEAIKQHIQKIFKEIPIYGEKKIHQQLLEDGYTVSLNSVSRYRKEMGLKAVLAVRPINTSIANTAHPKHSYKLIDIEIVRANQIWSTDITYIKINGGMVYMAAIIDWYSKAVLSWKISNCMDTDLVMGVLNEALTNNGTPEIFNTDQGSQYTSYIHTQTLKNNGIIISMDGKGRATDNICIERFWRSAKVERIYLNEYNSIRELKDDVKDDVKDYMEFYNDRRFHETLEYKKPMCVYRNSLKLNRSDYEITHKSVA